jgi:hypothetical protein
VSDAAPGLFRIEGLRFRVWPVLFTALLGFGIPPLASLTVPIVEHFTALPERPEMPWIAGSYVQAVQLVYALIAIALLKPMIRADFGLHRPRGKSYVRAAILWGVFLGLLMTAVDYLPQILAHRPPADKPYPLTELNLAGWFSFEGLVVGPTDETLFRGLLVTYLAATLPGRISFRRYEMGVAGVIVALILALPYVADFFTRTMLIALGGMFYTFVLGVLLAYWFEKSQSLLAPIVGHGVSSLMKIALIFAMVALWH